MACTNSNQGGLASPTTRSSSSQSSRRQFISGDQREETSDDVEPNAHENLLETGTEAMLDHVHQLIVDLFVVDDTCCGASFRFHEDAVVKQTARLVSMRNAKHGSNNLGAKADGDATTSERLLETKLARVLVELAGEQENLHLAAKAGNALLEELGAAREELGVLRDELNAVQMERDQAVRKTQQLWDQNAALETEVRCGNTPYRSWDSAGPLNELSDLEPTQQQQQQQPSLTSRECLSRTHSWERCASREVKVPQLEQQCMDKVRRRCLELELGCEREQQRQRELVEKIQQLQQQRKAQRLETVRAQEDLEFVTVQLEHQTQEGDRVQAVRDTWHCTARRLKAENDGLRTRLAARDELVERLEYGKARAATQLQVAENRTMSTQAVTKRVTKTLRLLQKQLEHALQQQQSGRARTEADTKPCEKKADDDMEQLLQDATREVAALRLKNRVLRRQCSSGANLSDEWSRMQGRRRKTLCTESPAMTAADVLALGSQEEPKRDATARSSSHSDSGSAIEPTSSSIFEPESETTASIAKAAALLSRDGKERRKMSLNLNWVGERPTSNDDTAAALEEKLRSVIVWWEGEHHAMLVDENQVECVLHEETEALTTSSSIVTHHAALSCLSHIDNHCNNPNPHVSGSDGKDATRLSVIECSECPQVRELPSKEFLETKATEVPPTPFLYLGLSFIACATVATAAGFLVRR